VTGVLLTEHSGTAVAAPHHDDTVGFYQTWSGAGNIAIVGQGIGGADGIHAVSDSGWGLYASSGSNASIVAEATAAYAVYGLSHGAGTGVIGLTDIGGWGIIGEVGGPTAFSPNAGSVGVTGYDRTNTVGGIGVNGTSLRGVGIEGNSETGFGVLGISQSASGVHGVSDTNFGVSGECTDGAGVLGTSVNNIGGYFIGVLGGRFRGSGAPLQLDPAGGPGAPGSGAHDAGQIYLDSLAVVWVCTAGGTPGTWVRLTRVPSGTPGGALNYLPAPIRLYDTRSSPAPLPLGKGLLAGNTTYTIQVTGTAVNGVSVPPGATGVFGNLTVTSTQGPGDLILWPDGAAKPNASNINYGTGQTVANAFNVGLSAGGVMDLFVHVSGTDVIIDVAGFVM
jgi:hypothetical protein